VKRKALRIQVVIKLSVLACETRRVYVHVELEGASKRLERTMA